MDGLVLSSFVEVYYSLLYSIMDWMTVQTFLISTTLSTVIECEELTVMNGAMFYTNLLQYGSVATYTCNEGYIPDNTSTTRTCTMDGWTGSEFFCRGIFFALLYNVQTFLISTTLSTGIECEELTVMNGIITYSSQLQIGSVATYTCNEGYMSDDASSRTRTCMSNGWSGSQFSCNG